MDIFYEVVTHAFLFFLWLGSIAGIGIGLGMLVAPMHMLRLNQYCSRWINTVKLETELDRPRWTERFFYRHHRWTGAALGVGGVYVLYAFLLAHTMRKVQVFVKDDIFGLLDAFSAIAVIVGVLAVVLGGIMFDRPSLLRELENAANRWISTEALLSAFHGMHFSFDNHILRHRKTAGGFLLVGGLYGTLVLGHLLLSGDWKVLVGG